MARNVASLPFMFKHVALMPDVHLGKGALVGSVLATRDAIIPAAVGVDIGCGMAAVQTPYTAPQLEGKEKKIRKAIEAAVPVGFEQNKEADKAANNWQGWQNFKQLHKGVQQLESKALKQLGSLGGGKPFKPKMQVNCHHNYAEQEVHFDESVYVTRKGAVRAREEDYGIIPGSMGAKSFIVKGKGNAHSYCSCSHGAGRLMSRKKAKHHFSLDDLIQQTSGVECRKDPGVLDEIPGAYKPIDEVMAQQSDLVEVVATLKQVICVKG